MKTKRTVIFVCALAVLLTAALMIASSAPKKAETETIYLVCFGKNKTLAEANRLSATAKLRGGGGYVLIKDGYHVVLSCYVEKADAEAVCEKLSGEGGYVVELEIQNESEAYFTCKTLADLSVAFDRGETGYSAALLEVTKAALALGKEQSDLSRSAGAIVERLRFVDSSAFSAEIKYAAAAIADLLTSSDK